jgi:ribonuclease HI
VKKINNMKKLISYTDGGARGNPGPAGIGAVLYNEDKKVVAEISRYLGVATNNQAEYKALISALRKAIELKADELDCYLDSELVVKQLKREYKVKNAELAPLFLEIHNLSLSFKKITYTHIPREKNKAADQLANEAMDRGGEN